MPFAAWRFDRPHLHIGIFVEFATKPAFLYGTQVRMDDRAHWKQPVSYRPILRHPGRRSDLSFTLSRTR